jgi:serine/threonine-protein kinase HipA
MRQAHIFYKDQLAGILTENDAGYEFRYLPEYISHEKAKAVSMTLPLQDKAYTSPVLFPFFDGLIPEGWLLDVALRSTDISILDRSSKRYSFGRKGGKPCVIAYIVIVRS